MEPKLVEVQALVWKLSHDTAYACESALENHVKVIVDYAKERGIPYDSAEESMLQTMVHYALVSQFEFLIMVEWTKARMRAMREENESKQKGERQESWSHSTRCF